MRRSLTLTCSCTLALILLTAGVLPGQSGTAPTFKEVNGFDFGERITLHHQMVRYLERLASVSERVAIVNQGDSWEGRPLLLAIVTAPENHARLQQIQDGARRLSDPRTLSAAEAASLVASQPAVVWIGGSIHGFELSGSEGVLKLLEHLATRDDQATRDVLKNAVVLVDPMLNPDGREAFATLNQQNAGRQPNPLPEDWGNDFAAWEALKFRTGHYYFDTNRDWFAHTQRETRHRVATLQAWRPQVVIDAHEMGPEMEFYFDPPAEPVSPYFPEFSTRWLQRFGDAYSRAFDAGRFDYTTRELYNFFYPGYTTSYGSFLGGVGMLYEQGSSRGLALMRRDGSVRTLADALEQQYTAAWAAVRLAAGERETLLREFHESYRAAVEDGRRGVRQYVIGPNGDPSLVGELVDLLRRNGVEVGRVTEPATLSGVRDRAAQSGTHAVAPGAFVIDAAQPRNRLIRALLEPHVEMPAAFLEEARARVDRAENPRFYDITAWSLPLLFNVEASSGSGGTRLAATPLGEGPPLTIEMPERNAEYAYVLDGRQAGAMAAAYHLRHRDHRVSIALKPTRVGGRGVHGGSVIARVRRDADRLHADVREVAQAYRLNLAAVDTGAAAEGFGTLAATHVVALARPEVALLAEHPLQGYSFGWAWYTLDRQYRIPSTVVRVRSVATTPLQRFNVMILPEVISQDELAAVLGEPGLERLRRWVLDGGTLVALGSGVEFVRERLKLIALRSWYDVSQQSGGGGEKRPPAQRFDVPGAIFRGVLDPESWLSAGYAGDLPLLVNSSRIYLPPDGPPSASRRVPIRYAADAPTRLSGHAWRETLERLPGTVALYEERVGRGRVIAFTEDPNFRGYWRGANRLFLNAVVLGPSAP